MEGQEIPQLNEECKQELNRIVLEFLRKRLPSEAISKIEVIEVEVKFKREDKEVLLSINGGCIPGTPEYETDPCLIWDPMGNHRWETFS